MNAHHPQESTDADSAAMRLPRSTRESPPLSWPSQRFAALMVVGAMSFAPSWGLAQGTLEGDQRLACEAILCLAASKRPHECEPSIRRYFSFNAKKLADRRKKRMSFLQLCPKQSQEDVARIVDGHNSDALLPDTPPVGPSDREGIQAAIDALMSQLRAAETDAADKGAAYQVCAGRMSDANDCQNELNAYVAARRLANKLADELRALRELLARTP